MNNIISFRFFARFYFVDNHGRISSVDKEVYTSDIKQIKIPDNCLFIEVFGIDSSLRKVTPQDVKVIERYLIGKRFDRARSSMKDNAEKFSFVMNKVYRPHIELDEKRIKNGIYTSSSEEQGEA